MGNKMKREEYIFKITADKIRSNQIKSLVSFCVCKCIFRLKGKDFFFFCVLVMETPRQVVEDGPARKHGYRMHVYMIEDNARFDTTFEKS
jgi:hypothetical protein